MLIITDLLALQIFGLYIAAGGIVAGLWRERLGHWAEYHWVAILWHALLAVWSGQLAYRIGVRVFAGPGIPRASVYRRFGERGS